MKKVILLFFGFFLCYFSTFSVNAKTQSQGFVPAQVPPVGYALVYIYRPNVPPAWVKPKIIVDSETILKLPNKGYSWFYLREGMHIIKTQWGFLAAVPSLEFPLTVKDNTIYFLRLKGSISNMGSYSNVYTGVTLVPWELARKELAKIKRYWKSDPQVIH